MLVRLGSEWGLRGGRYGGKDSSMTAVVQLYSLSVEIGQVGVQFYAQVVQSLSRAFTCFTCAVLGHLHPCITAVTTCARC